MSRYKNSHFSAQMACPLPKRPDASARRLSDLRVEANQRRMWAKLASYRGRPAVAAAHLRKAEAAERALKTLTT